MDKKILTALEGESVTVAACGNDLDILEVCIMAFVQIDGPGGWVEDGDVAYCEIAAIGKIDRRQGILVAVIDAAAKNTMSCNGKMLCHSTVDLAVKDAAFVEVDGFIAFDSNDLIAIYAWTEIPYFGCVGFRFVRIGRIQKQMQRIFRIAVAFKR